MKQRKNIYIDCEWFINQDIYLIGYSYDSQTAYQLMGFTLNKTAFQTILCGVDNIYVYGPDIGMLEKYFGIELKPYYRCFNLLSIIKKIEPNLLSYKLCDLEVQAGIYRDSMQYKSNIWKLHEDWKDPIKRYRAIKYNEEDVINLVKVKRYFFQKNGITRADIDKWRME